MSSKREDEDNRNNASGLKSPELPELFFALVYPIGTDSDLLVRTLSSGLEEVGYEPEIIHLIDRLSVADESNIYDRYTQRINRGNQLCKDLGTADAFALFCASEIQKDREERYPDKPIDERVSTGRAYIIRSLKRPQEIQTLRAIYGDALIVIAAHCPLKSRSMRLGFDIARSGVGTITDSYKPQAEELIARDERELAERYGQRVSDTFPMADVFVDASHPDKLKPSIERFIEILFGHPFHTPTRMEYGMFHAQGAALRSADLSRQVGAAIANEDGEILALGMNEVPKGGGGLYWEGGDETDNRDFTMGFDVSTEIKRSALRQVLDRLHQRGWLEKPADDLLDDAWNAVSGTSLMNVGEFGRQVHAEMAAIVDAARRGVSISGQTLYTTTFPCHVCARHIVSAGIARVVYNEPYPKSLAGSLHLDSIAVDDDEDRDISGRTHFVPFVGLAPHLYVRLFRMEGQGWRKDENGEIVNWTKAQARPRLSNAPATYIPKEVGALKRFIMLSAPKEEDQPQAERPGAP